ncbi:hypothetical protein SPOG_04984 [Schizosaccharomyces cryophilus OY26]|uniref:Uncharacterized protein n=1 Tax=Schizosaccharomyces cryophilus (strain OY26 / ATCC MYA-4695 / CBS 11777 / NBRC 106824 / NRRL Y48691) TaxID=653667 RepID=S9XEP1_SCHCR|nr:uncharacterized protein SPOG_04984 [Schizosaccharomyces cryophilus OY26]EPY52256.1 hypothetical protein SPOG_04984 [Schizosaccharomyces cryophilus OY26]
MAKQITRKCNRENRTFLGITNDKLEIKGNLRLPVEINNRRFYETFIITPISENEVPIDFLYGYMTMEENYNHDKENKKAQDIL